jgi:acetyl-CoA carboxylase biotin carboxylase subunit
VYAEDPTTAAFLPSPGTLGALRAPAGPWVRNDGGYYPGAVVPSAYDPLLSKLSVWAPDRPSAVRRMRRALDEYVVTGIRTNLAFHQKLFAHPDFIEGRYHTGFITEHASALLGYSHVPAESEPSLAAAIALAAAVRERRAVVEAADQHGADQGQSPWVRAHRANILR